MLSIVQRVDKGVPETLLMPALAATDITTVFGAADFLIHPSPDEPWARQCLISLVESVANHRGCLLPLPTPSGDEALLDLVTLCEKNGLVRRHSDIVATDVASSEKDLEERLREFRVFVVTHRDEVWRFCEFHLGAHGRYFPRLGHAGRFITDGVRQFWRESALARGLVRDVAMPAELLLIAFDVFQRGQVYYEILSDTGAQYLPHPLRSYLFAPPPPPAYRQFFSWGAVVANLVEREKLGRDVYAFVDLLLEIRDRRTAMFGDRVLLPDEVFDGERTIAAQLGIPATVRREIVAGIGIVSGILGNVPDGLPPKVVAACLFVSSLLILANPEERYVPGKLGRIRVMRRHLDWKHSRS